MLNHPTLDRLNAMGLAGIARAFDELTANPEAQGLTPPGMACPAARPEWSFRHDRKLAARLRFAKLRHQAAPEEVDYRSSRKLDRGLFTKLIAGDCIAAHDNLVICGPTGVGKSWLACALGRKACRDDRSVLYQRVPKLFSTLALARGDGRHARFLAKLGSVQLLILDDWGLEPLDAKARHDLLEILEERYGRRSTIITSQLPISAWHEVIGDPTYADAIVDRAAPKPNLRLDRSPKRHNNNQRPARPASGGG